MIKELDTVVLTKNMEKYRMEHTQKFKGELAAICEELHSIEAVSGHKVVRPAPKKLVEKKSIRQGGH